MTPTNGTLPGDAGDFLQSLKNQATWSSPASRRDLDSNARFTDPGERAALNYAYDHVPGQPILDLGVGTGRTIPLLKPMTQDYRALDFLPDMVAVSRQRHPDARIDIGDARDLEQYPEAHFGLVNFSYNGIDAVSAADRHRVFRAVRRVLAPGGLFVFSTLNLDGPSYRERPWRLRIWHSKTVLNGARQVVRQLVGTPESMVNWLKSRNAGERGPGYAVAPLSAHRFGLVVHYTTLGRQLDQLAEEGFDRDGPVFESVRGDRVYPDSDTSKIDWFTFVARRA
jgi:SAM-dependent methyltransferase